MNIKNTILKTFFPFETFEICFIFFILFIDELDTNYFFLKGFMSKYFNLNFDSDFIKRFSNRIFFYYGVSFEAIKKYFLIFLNERELKKDIVCPLKYCIHCKNELKIVQKTKRNIRVYFFEGPVRLMLSKKFCYKCFITYDLSNYTDKNKTSYIYPNYYEINFTKISDQTVIDNKLLHYFDELFMRNGITFEGFSDSYNEIHKNLNISLNRLRLSEAYFVFKIKSLYYNSSELKIEDIHPKKTGDFLKDNFENYKIKFVKKWANIHNECKIKCCTSTSMFFCINFCPVYFINFTFIYIFSCN